VLKMVGHFESIPRWHCDRFRRFCRAHPRDQHTNTQIDRLTDRQTDRPTDWPTNQPTNQQTDRQTEGSQYCLMPSSKRKPVFSFNRNTRELSSLTCLTAGTQFPLKWTGQRERRVRNSYHGISDVWWNW